MISITFSSRARTTLAHPISIQPIHTKFEYIVNIRHTIRWNISPTNIESHAFNSRTTDWYDSSPFFEKPEIKHACSDATVWWYASVHCACIFLSCPIVPSRCTSIGHSNSLSIISHQLVLEFRAAKTSSTWITMKSSDIEPVANGKRQVSKNGNLSETKRRNGDVETVYFTRTVLFSLSLLYMLRSELIMKMCVLLLIEYRDERGPHRARMMAVNRQWQSVISAMQLTQKTWVKNACKRIPWTKKKIVHFSLL